MAFANSIVAEGVHEIVAERHKTVVVEVETVVVEHETEVAEGEMVKLGS